METKEITKLKERLRFLVQEIAMGSYYDGWTLSGLKKERKEVEERIKQLEKDNI